MKLIGYFNQLLADTVNLNKSRLDDLDTRVHRITEALKTAANLDGEVLDTVPQGSWAHRTIVRPAANIEFDADFLVQLDENTDWNGNPRSYANAVWKALHDHSTYGSMSTQKNRCVRISYANDCHIDVVPYVILASGREVIVNRDTNEFEDTNPVGFTAWIQEKDDLTNGNLRKVIRLLKYLRDHQHAFNLKSVLLTTLVGNVVDQWRTYDTDYYCDVPTTLCHLVKDLDGWLQARWTMPTVTDPSCPSTNYDHRWSEPKYQSFRTRFHDLATSIEEAYEAGTVGESVTAWQDVFGPDFPSSLRSAAVATASAAITRSYIPLDAAPGEEFIEDRGPVLDAHRVTITCEVSEPNRRERRALRARGGHVPKWRKLEFKVVSTDVTEPFKVFWKVRNRGREAEAANGLRGQILADEGGHRRSEHSQWAGHHYVECYIVKNGVCVARAHEPVIID